MVHKSKPDFTAYHRLSPYVRLLQICFSDCSMEIKLRNKERRIILTSYNSQSSPTRYKINHCCYDNRYAGPRY
jgi:hypothetical protein